MPAIMLPVASETPTDLVGLLYGDGERVVPVGMQTDEITADGIATSFDLSHTPLLIMFVVVDGGLQITTYTDPATGPTIDFNGFVPDTDSKIFVRYLYAL